MYIYHFKLEQLLQQSDEENKGLVTVGQLETILKSEEFNFPENAVDTVLIEMLNAPDMSQIDRNCYIKIDTFMESLCVQFTV